MDIYLNPITGDLEMVNGDLPFTTDYDTDDNPESIKQFLVSKLLTFYGECFLNENLGIPYFDDAFGKNPNLILIDAIFKKEILETPGVIELNAYSFSYDSKTRKANLSFTAQCIGGTIDFSEPLPV